MFMKYKQWIVLAYGHYSICIQTVAVMRLHLSKKNNSLQYFVITSKISSYNKYEDTVSSL